MTGKKVVCVCSAVDLSRPTDIYMYHICTVSAGHLQIKSQFDSQYSVLSHSGRTLPSSVIISYLLEKPRLPSTSLPHIL